MTVRLVVGGIQQEDLVEDVERNPPLLGADRGQSHQEDKGNVEEEQQHFQGAVWFSVRSELKSQRCIAIAC